jgi:hypothetical protein
VDTDAVKRWSLQLTTYLRRLAKIFVRTSSNTRSDVDRMCPDLPGNTTNAILCREMVHELNGAEPLLRSPLVAQLLKNFPTFYGTRRFMTVFKRAPLWSLAKTTRIKCVQLHRIYLISILISFSHLRLGLPSRFLPSGFPTKPLHLFPISPLRAVCPAHLILHTDI